jgi:hypothetical protein
VLSGDNTLRVKGQHERGRGDAASRQSGITASELHDAHVGGRTVIDRPLPGPLESDRYGIEANDTLASLAAGAARDVLQGKAPLGWSHTHDSQPPPALPEL